MRVGDLSEDLLLSRIVPFLPSADRVEIPSGDDCAVLGLDGPRVSISTDMLVEGTHFRREWSSGYDIGWRSAMQNLADAVAMGSRPVSLVVSMEIPGDLEVTWVEDFARGLADAARLAGAGVDGGDLTSGPAICVSVTVVGDPEGRAPRLRSSARAGEDLVHCGVLGWSGAGYRLLREHGVGGADAPRAQTSVDVVGGDTMPRTAAEDCGGVDGLAGSDDAEGPQRAAGCEGFPCAGQRFVEAFRRPNPPLLEVLEACRVGSLGALMDVSDGLVRDARRIAQASGVWIDLDGAALEDDIAVLEGCGFSHEESLELVLSGGEDHGFLGSCAGEPPAGFRVIGRIVEAYPGGRVTLNGSNFQGPQGWDHFATS